MTKEQILELTDGGFAFYQFVIPGLELSDQGKCKLTLNPFYDDKQPGLSIYFDESSERWRFKDFGSSDDGKNYCGDVFDFAAHYYNLLVDYEFRSILERMADDLQLEKSYIITDMPQSTKRNINIGINQSSEMLNGYFQNDSYNFPGPQQDLEAWIKGFDIGYAGIDGGLEKALSYFDKYGITIEILKEYSVRAIAFYKTIKDGKVVEHRVWRELTIAYEDANFAKLYSPYSNLRFFYIGSKPKNYIFGQKEIARRLFKTRSPRDLLVITGGEKDVLTLTSMGYDAICFNSETAAIPQDAFDNIFPMYKHIVVMYDIDETGKSRASNILAEVKIDFSASVFELPSDLWEADGKDVSDYVELGFDIEWLKASLNSLVTGSKSEESIEAEVIEEPLHESRNELEYSPTLPETIFNELPPSLKELCSLFTDRRDKDLVLLSTITSISTFFPSVGGFYNRRSVGMNLYLFVSAPASSGKGVMSFARVLCKQIQAYLKDEYERNYIKYISDQAAYREAVKKNPDLLPPKEPKQQTMIIPANISVSKLIELLDANQTFGLMFETEGDTLTNALGTEWGNFSDVLRKAFHHEPVTMARRGNKEFLEVDKPHLSVVLSGTDNQIGNLLKDVENGFFSRMLFYTFRAKVEWHDQFKDADDTIEIAFEDAAEKMLQYWTILMDSKVSIRLHEDHAKKINEYFNDKLREFYKIHGDTIVPSVKRLGLIFYRIAMLLTTIRHLDNNKEISSECFIEEVDFRIAHQIVDTLFEHLKIVYKRVENSMRDVKLNTRQWNMYEQLPDEFNREQYDALAEKLSIKYKTAERYIGVYIKKELLMRFEHGKYQKV